MLERNCCRFNLLGHLLRSLATSLRTTSPQRFPSRPPSGFLQSCHTSQSDAFQDWCRDVAGWPTWGRNRLWPSLSDPTLAKPTLAKVKVLFAGGGKKKSKKKGGPGEGRSRGRRSREGAVLGRAVPGAPMTHATHKHTPTTQHTNTHKPQVELGLAKVGLAKVGHASTGHPPGQTTANRLRSPTLGTI